ncbi:MAG TPA: PD-(D/E)XK nuclease family protein [Candidatus Paceibacterota bacterium]|nr:PD-(D/E)XK nuclease family protein [Candidatus Paceibacterota bacterium]
MGDYTSLEDFRQRAGYEIDGVWYPRVTAIVGIKAKPALYRYYARMSGIRAAEEVRERSAAEGSMVHDAVEAILKGTEPVIPGLIRPSVDAFQEFLRNNHVQPLMVEDRVISHAQRYAGTVDVVAEINGTIGVLDIKTGKAIYRDYGMQTAAYTAALREDANLPQPSTAWILRLDQSSVCQDCGAALRVKGGDFRVLKARNGCLHRWGSSQGEFELREMTSFDEDWSAFLAAKHLWEWEYRDKLAKLR